MPAGSKATPQDRLPDIRPDDQPDLFSVLGTVERFRKPDSLLNRYDFETWLQTNREALAREVSGWLPRELAPDKIEMLIGGLASETITVIDAAIADREPVPAAVPRDSRANAAPTAGLSFTEVPAEPGEEPALSDPSGEKLLDRLLYKGVLPRYAFPTDVATFYVFDRDKTTAYRPAFRFTPSQGLAIALTQYAPGREVWIAGKRFVSRALYSPMQGDRLGCAIGSSRTGSKRHRFTTLSWRTTA
jgi:hypothetical protein